MKTPTNRAIDVLLLAIVGLLIVVTVWGAVQAYRISTMSGSEREAYFAAQGVRLWRKPSEDANDHAHKER